MDNGNKARVAFLYPNCAQGEWEDFLRGGVPSHRLWGQVDLSKEGWKTVLCPRAKSCPDLGWRWLLRQTSWLWRKRGSVDAVFAVHEVSALLPLCLRRIGLLKVPLVVLNFGLLHPKNVTGWRRFLWKTFLPAADSVISLVEGQISEVKRAFGVPARMQFYVPLGVDTDFVREGVSEPQEAAACESGFVLAVGTNEGKDYGTLLEALPLGLKLVIITDEHNARLIRRHRCFGEGIEVLTRVPMRQLRDWYHRAALMVIPLHDTAYGSGHSVFLENLALGKLVVVSESRGMKGYARSKQNCLTVPVGDSKGLRETIQSVMNATGHYCGLGEAAGKDAVENFGIKKFASRVADILLDAIRCAGGQDRLRALDGRQRGGGKEEQKCMSLGN